MEEYFVPVFVALCRGTLRGEGICGRQRSLLILSG
jgi:hypothetical protein